MVEIGLLLARFLHYAAATSLAGLSLFPLYAYAGAEPDTWARWRRTLVLRAAIVALLSGLGWFAFAVANMGGNLGDLADMDMLWTVARDTSFGNIWTLRMLLSAVIVGMAASKARSNSVRLLIMPLLAAVLLMSLAGTGHTQVEEGWAGIIHTLSDSAHLLAAGAWLGGLIPLAAILRRSGTMSVNVRPQDVDQVLLRFSGVGYIAVATLIGSGLVNSWFLVGSLSGLLTTPYGQLLLVKLALFGGMLALAVANRFWLVPSMSKARADAADELAKWSAKLRTHVLGEQILGWMVLAAVSLLGIMQPGTAQ